MTPGDGGPWEVVYRATRRARSDARAGVALVAGAVVPAVLLAAWLIGERWPLGAAGPLLLVAGAVLAVAGLVLVLARRWVRPVTGEAVAAAAERGRGLPEGSLRAVIELGRGLPEGVSAGLFRHSERDIASRLAGATAAELAGDVGARARTRRTALLGVVAALAALTTAAGFTAPDRARAGWTPLLHPVAHLRGPELPPLVVHPGDTAVARGGVVRVAVEAPFRDRVTVEWQSAGDVPRTRTLDLADGQASEEIGPVDAVVRYRVRAPDGAVSETFRVRPVDPLLLAGFGMELEYPPHTGRGVERLAGELSRLAVPEGTVLRVTGRATRVLDRAVFRRADGGERTAVSTGDTFGLDWPLDRASTGRWELMIQDGAGAAASPLTLDLDVRPDAPPLVRIVVPGVDTLMAGSRMQTVVTDASDDYGMVAAELVYRRIGARGDRGPPVRAPLAIDAGAERALLRTVLDARDQPLGPGDGIEYYVAVRDNSPAGQVGVSRTYTLRLPSRTSLRDEARRETESLVQAVETATDQARALDRRTRELSRRAAARSRSSATGPGGAASPAMDHTWAAEVQSLAADHEDAQAALRAIEERLERLRQALAEAGLRDPELERRLDQLRDLHRQLAASDPAEGAEALRRAAEALDPQAVAAALEQLMDRQEELRRRLDESLGLLERAAIEQEMQTLAREAEEIAARQDALAAAIRHEVGGAAPAPDPPGEPGGDPDGDPGSDPARAGNPGGDPDGEPGGDSDGDSDGESEPSTDADAASRRAEQQEQLGAQTARLTDLLKALQQRLLQQGDPQAASQAGAAQQDGESASESMRQAAEQARDGKGEEAAASGEDAARSMTSAARALDEARAGMGEAGRRQVQEAVQQAAQDALRLAEREDALREQMEAAQGGGGSPGAQGGELQEMQSEQAAVRQGLQQLGQNLSDADRQTGLVDRATGQALARAMLAMDQVLERLQSGTSMPVRQAERAVDALNQLALALLDTDTRMAGSGGGPIEEALRRLAEMAGEQGALNAQGAAFAPLDVTAPVEAEQLRQLAEGQRGIARRIGDVSGLVGGREDVLGRLDQLAGEASAIARELEGGRLDAETRDRQERLFHRLLDAGRSLEREEYTDERAGEAASAVAGTTPEQLDPTLLDPTLRYPTPSAEQLRGLSPAYRRLILEYFDRLNRGEAQVPRAGEREP